MYLRFVVHEIDDDSGRELGVFHAVRYLRDEGKLYPYEMDEHDSVRQWFNDNLEKPTNFARGRAISWFKDTAHEHLSRVRALIAILQNHDVVVKTFTTDKVGYIAYEDEFQIIAEPFSRERYS